MRNDYAAIKRAVEHQYNNGLLEGTVCKILFSATGCPKTGVSWGLGLQVDGMQ